MSSHLCLSFRFLDPAFHGRGDRGEPEWPPSPLRAFQSLVAAAARQQDPVVSEETGAALRWLEQQAAPTIITPASAPTRGYVLSVPNNAMDIVASAWRRGNYSSCGDASPATHRTMKRVRPTRMLGGDAVHYLWPIREPVSPDVARHVDALASVSKQVVALGWGVDMVVGGGDVLSHPTVQDLPGEWWLPYDHAEDAGSRIPVTGSLDAVVERYLSFLQRVRPEGFVPPKPLTCFRKVAYRRATDPPPRPFAAFSLLKEDGSGFRPFDAARQALTVAGMIRHAARRSAEQSGWDEAYVNTFVLGHGASSAPGEYASEEKARFAYLPLPSIETRGPGRARTVGAVRRVMLMAFSGRCGREFAWARRALSGQDLINKDTGEVAALLSLVPASDGVVQAYTRSASSWATVTPVVLPGYDDPGHYRRQLKQNKDAATQKQMLERLHDRIDGLIRKAITQAGFPQALTTHAELEWRVSGFWPGTDLASRYGVPDHLKRYPRYHVKVTWRDSAGRPLHISGPICLGGGRFYGIGLFAARPEEET